MPKLYYFCEYFIIQKGNEVFAFVSAQINLKVKF